jgi:class 3 adenylate cyclase/predicted ATPase
VCSVLFCDVVGFTPLSEARDPEAVRELLSEYFAVARTVIGRYGGVVEKFIGDAVMAVWGTPAATEGDAERAVRAALDLVIAVAELGSEAGLPGLAARAGVVTGEVAVNLAAVGEGMVAGDAVNTASRVQAAAEPGSVLVDEATQRLAGRAIGFADAGDRQLKGKVGPVQLWRATRVLSAVGGSQRVDGLEAPLTGRDAELRTIKDLFHAAADRRVPRLVLVSGPAGVGKSRLGWEFEKYADGLKAQVWWHRGRCLSYGEGVAFWALTQIVRQRLGIAEEDPPEVAAGKLAQGLDRYVPDPGERAYAGLRVARLLGVAFAGDGGGPLSREELFAGWRLFFERLAAVQPVVLVVEDAQHGDAGLLDFLDYLIDWVRDLPVYVVVLARPELGQARPGFGTGRNRTALTLDPLDAASMDTLVDALVPGMPAAARAKITAQAQGIPLFAVETVRSLVDRDIVQPVEGVYRLTGDVGELAVPDSLHALLASRLDALDPRVRRLVADAAVLGATFPAEALIAVSGQDEATVRAALAELVRREVLSVSADRLSPERGSYAFAQNMLRQVAYGTLSRRDRKARHLAVAAHLRAAFPGDGEEVTEVIARHYLDALEAVPDDGDAGPIRGQAIAVLARAADRAVRTGAPARAAASYATAARLTQASTKDAQPAAAALWEHAAEAALTNAGYAAAIEQAGQAADAYGQGGDTRSAARAQVIAGQALRQWGRHAEAREQLTAAVAVLREDPDADTVRALGELARLEVFAGSPEADALSAEALALGQDLAVDEATLAGLFTTRGVCHGFAGRRPEAASYLREAARLAGQAGDTVRLGRALLNLSDAVTGTDPAAGAEAARAAAAHSRRAGARILLAVAVGNLAQALLMTGDWDAAGAELAQAADADGLAGLEHLACYRAWLAALRRHSRRPGSPGRAGRPAGQRRPPGPGAHRGRGGVHRRRPPPARRRPAPRPHRPGPRRRPGHQPRAPAVGLAAGRPRRTRPSRHRHRNQAAGPARRLPARAARPDAARRTRPGPRPPVRRRQRPGRRPDVRRRDRRAAPALHPLPPGPRPTRPRRPPGRPRRHRGLGGRGRRGRRHRHPTGLPAANRPRGHHPARQAPHHGLVTTAPASPRHLPATPSSIGRQHGRAFRNTASSPATCYRACWYLRPRR